MAEAAQRRSFLPGSYPPDPRSPAGGQQPLAVRAHGHIAKGAYRQVRHVPGRPGGDVPDLGAAALSPTVAAGDQPMPVRADRARANIVLGPQMPDTMRVPVERETAGIEVWDGQQLRIGVRGKKNVRAINVLGRAKTAPAGYGIGGNGPATDPLLCRSP